MHTNGGVFAFGGRRWALDVSLGLTPEGSRPARVSVQAVIVRSNGDLMGSYPVQSFDVGGGLVSARFARLSGFCPENLRVRMRVRSLDVPTSVNPFVVAWRYAP
jgi:hypothetical protein